jgi:translation initiation factor 2B subunit (eIF-2B alpha/beta/delta family)
MKKEGVWFLTAHWTGATEAAMVFLDYMKKSLSQTKSMKELYANLASLARRFYEERPTSALLVNTIKKLAIRALELRDRSFDEALHNLLKLIDEEVDYSRRSVDELAQLASRRIPDDSVVLTHSYSTTVIKTLSLAHEKGKIKQVFVTESRPGGEGLHTARVLSERGLKTTLITDSAVSFFLDKVSLVVVGAEAITANGALVNKIGTSMIALASYHRRKRMIVLAGTYKFSFETVYGELIRIPEASLDLLGFPKDLLYPNVLVKAPLMDVTRPQYIDAIITEKGVTSPAGVPLIIWESLSDREELRTMSIHQVLSMLEEKAR